MPLFALLAWRAFVASTRARRSTRHNYALLRSDEIFAPLPVAAVERLGHALVPVEVAAGEDVIVEGTQAIAIS